MRHILEGLKSAVLGRVEWRCCTPSGPRRRDRILNENALGGESRTTEAVTASGAECDREQSMAERESPPSDESTGQKGTKKHMRAIGRK